VASATTSLNSPGRRAQVDGLGLIGGSIGLALRRAGWHVTGHDLDPDVTERALTIGALDAAGEDELAELVVVATPAASVAGVARARLAQGPPQRAVTDVAGVKAGIVAEVGAARFVGGHPMAGSEQDGLDGADADLFAGATWVLTPTPDTDHAAFATVRSVVAQLGAEVVALPPDRHDALVAMVSHVPHLAAATLMGLAADTSEEHAVLLRLAAGGFRDMTRIAAGRPAIWPDICSENSVAILAVLDDLLARLGAMRDVIETGDRERLLALLEQARAARRNLPGQGPRPESTVELRVPIPDEPGVLAQVTTLVGELGVNIHDLEIAHSSEGRRGVLVLAVSADGCEAVRAALAAHGYRSAVLRME
jgi:prephenate dehydrogenase